MGYRLGVGENEPGHPLQHHVDEFAARNGFLQLALGALSAGRRLDALLDRYAPPEGPRAPSLPGDARLVAFVLGLIAVSSQVRVMLRDAAARAPEAPAPAATPPARIPLR